MVNLVSAALATMGAVFLLLAGIGVVRLPDLFCRASATTKAATLGVGCVLAAAAVHFHDLQVITRVVATIAFLLLTAPVAAHMIARVAYFRGVPMWSGTGRDELREALSQGSRQIPAGGSDAASLERESS
jgi:multicomponent Na+:H+ antiporter subunit G